jgi:hypothetical protein
LSLLKYGKISERGHDYIPAGRKMHAGVGALLPIKKKK